MSSLLGITRFVCRILCLSYSVLAFVSIPFTLGLMGEDTKLTNDNDTVIVPLRVCMPKDFDIESISSSSITVSMEYSSSEYTCKGVDVLIFAVAVSLGISGVASLIYLFKDIRSIKEKGTLNLCFLLLQSGLVSAALLHEVTFWKQSYQASYDAMYDGKLSVQFPSNMILTSIACGFAFILILGLTVRKMLFVFFPPSRDVNVPVDEKKSIPDKVGSALVAKVSSPFKKSSKTSQSIESTDTAMVVGGIPYDDTSPSWTSV